MKELFDRVLASESTKNAWRHNYGSTEWKEANQVNKLLTGISLNQSQGCECIEDMFFLLKRSNINHIISSKMMNKLFQMMEGRTIMVHGCKPVGHASSQEDMISALKVSPGHIKYFTTFPHNWKEIVAQFDGKTGMESVKHLLPKESAQPALNDYSGPINDGGANKNTGPVDYEGTQRYDELAKKNNQKLKDMIIDLQQDGEDIELPKKINKKNLVNTIIAAENA